MEGQGQLQFNQLKECRHGWMLYNVNDKYVGRSLDLYGEHSSRSAASVDATEKSWTFGLGFTVRP